jgi:hypothetical protein
MTTPTPLLRRGESVLEHFEVVRQIGQVCARILVAMSDGVGLCFRGRVVRGRGSFCWLDSGVVVSKPELPTPLAPDPPPIYPIVSQGTYSEIYEVVYKRSSALPRFALKLDKAIGDQGW